ncbi:MAG: glycosyltransferase [Muribaculaceae bacterium]|nr:glycosyltransferase [Muribaculaceae bacterium]
MKISIITITYRDGALLKRAIDSIYAQELDADTELEHIIVSGDSEDDSEASALLRYAESMGSRIIRSKPQGCYNALNIGNAAATGDVIGLVHGSDMLADASVLAKVADTFRAYKPDFVYADIIYISVERPGEVLRRYGAHDFSPELLSKGIAPPHPSLYMSRDTLRRVGRYKEDYLIGADFDLFIRLFRGGFVGRYMPATTVAMEWGGLSTTLYNRIVVNTREKLRALRDNGCPVSAVRILLRYLHHPSRKKV